jgi:drug/metabolite transporter (DMT)-like permease
LSAVVVWVLTCLIWSTVWLFIKVGVSDLPPVTFAAYRLLIALLVLVPIALAKRIPLPRDPRDWRLVAGSGVLLLGANYAVVYWGMQFVSSGLTAVLQALTPAFGMVFAHLLLPDERVTRVKVVALGVGVAGIAIIFADQLDFSGMRSVWGSAAILSGAAFVAFAYVVMKKRVRDLQPTAITMVQMAAAFVPLTIFAIAVEGNPLALAWTPKTLAALLYLALLGSVVAAWLNYWLLQRMEATKVLLMGLAEPPVAMMIGAVALGETFSGRAIAGTVCILVSVALVLELIPAGRG